MSCLSYSSIFCISHLPIQLLLGVPAPLKMHEQVLKAVPPKRQCDRKHPDSNRPLEGRRSQMPRCRGRRLTAGHTRTERVAHGRIADRVLAGRRAEHKSSEREQPPQAASESACCHDESPSSRPSPPNAALQPSVPGRKKPLHAPRSDAVGCACVQEGDDAQRFV
jgi:hypothetical protein